MGWMSVARSSADNEFALSERGIWASTIAGTVWNGTASVLHIVFAPPVQMLAHLEVYASYLSERRAESNTA
jgi:hypothetical protein